MLITFLVSKRLASGLEILQPVFFEDIFGPLDSERVSGESYFRLSCLFGAINGKLVCTHDESVSCACSISSHALYFFSEVCFEDKSNDGTLNGSFEHLSLVLTHPVAAPA